MPQPLSDVLPTLLRLGSVALLLAVCFVVAARFREKWGTTPIAVLAGLFQVPQTFLAIGLTVPVVEGLSVSPGSVVFFPATIFAVLLVYVLEDEGEARRLVYGLLLANNALAVLLFLGQPLFDLAGGGNGLGLNPAETVRVSRVLSIGSVLLAVDAFILIRSFEWFGERVSRHLLARSWFSLVLALGFDALAFGPVAFGRSPEFTSALAISLAGKVAAASFYSLVFVLLLPWSRLAHDPRQALTVAKGIGPLTYKDRYQDLKKEAVRDSLTGVFNRAYFDHEMSAQTDRALVRGDRLLLLLIDLDSFKKINDTYGHPAGDRVLALFGETLRAVARQNDTVCRYGGEEFAILIAGGPLAITPGLFERTREEFNRLWRSATPPLPFDAPRFSLGGAAIPDDACNAEQLLALADQRLYAAKRAGGNRYMTE